MGRTKEIARTRGNNTPKFPFSEGSKVEVGTNKQGFKDAWYVATVLELNSVNLAPYLTHKLTVLVKFETLYAEDDKSKPLTMSVDPFSIRPLPPTTPLYQKQFFKVYDVVDAFYRDGWWKGVVSEVKKDKFYNVVFENPPHQMEFEDSQLRFRFEWVNGSWEKPPLRKRMRGLNFVKGRAVEICLDGLDSNEVWVTATIIKEVGFNSFLVKRESTNTNNKYSPAEITVDSFHIRPPPPLDSNFKDFKCLEKVDVLCDSGWRYGFITRVLSDDRFMVRLQNTKRSRQFTRSDIRPHMHWINGKWETTIMHDARDNNAKNTEVERLVKGHAEESPRINTRQRSIASPAKKPMSWNVKRKRT